MNEKVEKPWGTYETIYEDSNTKVKVIRISPGQRPSYQYHHKRTETWTLVQGEGTLLLDDSTLTLKKGDTVFIPKLSKHRMQNTGQEDLVFIEVQLGEYFGEDDIVRVSDDYNRESTR